MDEKKLADLVAIRKAQERSLESLIDQSDEVFDEVALQRKKLEDKMSSIIDNVTINDNDDAKQIDAKVSLFRAYDDVLANREKAFDRRISIRQKQKVADTTSQLADIVTEALLNLEFNNEYVPSSKVELTSQEKADIDRKFLELDKLSYDEIKEGELIKSKK